MTQEITITLTCFWISYISLALVLIMVFLYLKGRHDGAMKAFDKMKAHWVDQADKPKPTVTFHGHHH